MEKRRHNKGRSTRTYQYKLDRLKNWHAKREEYRQVKLDKAKKEGKQITLKEFKPLKWYVEQLKPYSK